MIPAISDHFILRAKECAPWLLDIRNLQDAIDNAARIEPAMNIYSKIRDAVANSKYLYIPTRSKNCSALIIVVADDRLVTVYPAGDIEGALS